MGAAALALLVGAGGARGEASFSDEVGDENAAPDITRVAVAAAADGSFDVTVEVANYPVLVGDSWINVWLDLDANLETGSSGFEALARFDAVTGMQFLVTRGRDLVAQPAPGLTASFAAGSLMLRIPRAVLGGGATLDVLAVSGRRQRLGAATFVASDYAPDAGTLAWRSGPAAHVDASNDHEAAPDLSTVRVTDDADGWVRFSITTANYAVLPRDAIVVIFVDADQRAATGEDGADVAIPYSSGQAEVQRWDVAERRWRSDEAARVRARNRGGVLTVEVHRSALGPRARFRFRLVAARFDLSTGTAAVDRAPDIRAFWPYSMSPEVTLVAGAVTTTPSRLRADRALTIRVPVRRSDAGRLASSATVRCDVRADGRRLRAVPRVRAGVAQCVVRVPEGARRIHGELTVRSGSLRVVARFSLAVR